MSDAAAVVASFDRLRPMWATRLVASESSVPGGQAVNFVERRQPLTFHSRVARDGKRRLITVVRDLHEDAFSTPGSVILAS